MTSKVFAVVILQKKDFREDFAEMRIQNRNKIQSVK